MRTAQQKLIAYSALSASFLLMQEDAFSQAQYYNNFTPNAIIHSTSPLYPDRDSIDIDLDGLPDFALFIEYQYSIWGDTEEKTITIEPLNGNRVADVWSTKTCYSTWTSVATQYDQRRMVEGLLREDTVSVAKEWTTEARTIHYSFFSGTGYADYCFADNKFGQFPLGETRFIGVSIKIDADWHYGWIRVLKGGYSRRLTIIDHTLNAIPNQPLVISAASMTNCPTPTSTGSALSGTSASLNWSPVPSASKYLLSGNKIGTPSTFKKSLPSNTATVGGLSSGTYSWKVRAQCDNDVISPVSNENIFTVPAPLALTKESENTGSAFDLDVLTGQGSTLISFNLALETVASIGIYDISGKLLERLNQHFGSGAQTIELDHNLSQGMYLITLSVNGIRETTRLVVQ